MRRRAAFLSLTALMLALPLAAQTNLERKIEAIAAANPVIARAHWGASAVDLVTNKPVYERNAHSWFVPASVQKLNSAATALTRLGPQYRFQTVLRMEGEVDNNGVLHGDIALIGAGDPAFCLPEFSNVTTENETGLACLDELTAAVVDRGITRITGNIIGDDTAFLWEPHAPGVVQSDLLWEYGAPASALTIHRNAVLVRIRPATAPGDPVLVSTQPALDYFQFDVQARTSARGTTTIKLYRGSSRRDVVLAGVIPIASKGASYLIAIPDPADFAAFALHEALLAMGIEAEGYALARHRYSLDAVAEPEHESLAVLESPPLLQILQEVVKKSQNLYAELTLLAASRGPAAPATRSRAAAFVRALARRAESVDDDLIVDDASGLSRMTMLTPAALTSLLVYMDRGNLRVPWASLFPNGGFDGTLKNRFRELRTATVTAKTGTMSHIGALSGYLETKAGRRVAFTILVNNAHAPGYAIRDFIDKIVIAISE